MEIKREAVVVGASGHAKVVISALRASGWTIRAAYDDDVTKWTKSILGVPITGPVDQLQDSAGVHAVIAIGDPMVRRSIAERYRCEWLCVIHPWTYVDPTAKIRPGSVVFAGAVLQPEVKVGQHTIINTSVTLDHGCSIGDYAHISPGSHLAGDVRVGFAAFLGTGVSVIRGITIGDGTIVGAGASVIRDLPDRVTAVGCPARIIKYHEV